MVFLRQKYYEAGGNSEKLLAYKLKKQQLENKIYKIKNPETKLSMIYFDSTNEKYVKLY